MRKKAIVNIEGLRRHARPIALLFFLAAGLAGGGSLFALPFGHMGRIGHFVTGYIGPTIALSAVNGEPVPWAGLRTGVEFDRAVAIGIAGSGLLTTVEQSDGDAADIGFAGLEFRTFLLSGEPLSLTFDLVIGGGAAGSGFHLMGGGGHHDSDEASDGFFAVEPAVGVLLQVNEYVRAELGLGYLFPSRVDLPGITDAQVGGPRASLAMSFGFWR